MRKNFAGVLRRAVRRHRREDGPQGRGHRVRVADDRRAIPCPTPPLHAAGSGDAGPRRARARSGAAPGRADRPAAPFYGARRWVLTRLHTRYSKETLSEDLIFREAKPVDGRARELERHQRRRGRAGEPTADGGVNNFQGRYIIRHYWDKPVACKDPHYDQWGGPPGIRSGRPTPTAAKGWRPRRAGRSCCTDGGPLAGAVARASPASRRTGGRRRQ